MTGVTRGVVVTGAAKGIGRAIVVRLARAGFRIYAGVRNLDDGYELRAEGGANILPVLLDITDQKTIAAAAQFIKEDLAGPLCGLVNNAGIAVAGPLEFLPVEEIRTQFEVNVIGQIAMMQAMLPLLRKSRGRIINIGSIAGRSAMPITGPYSASKFALEAISDSIRVELIPAGVDVIVIEPGMIATPIWQTSLKAGDRVVSQMPPEADKYYGKLIQAARERAASGDLKGLPPDAVAKVVEEALTTARPKTRYLVGKDARLRVLMQMLPDRFRDRMIARRIAKL